MSKSATESLAAESDRIGGWPHPRETGVLFGHDAAQQTLLTAVNGRMPHAWIFGGIKGIGKATLAYQLAKALLASRPGRPLASLETDPDIPAVRRIAAGAHPDLLVLRRPTDPKTGKIKNELPVDEVRRLGEFFARHAAEGGWRVAIVDAADDLNRNAANALLKTLEEPPPHGLLILIAHQPRSLIATIRSRCRLLAMPPLHESDLARALEVVAPDLPDTTALAALSGGSVGTALEMAEYDAPGLDKTLRTLAEARRPDAAAAHALANDLATAAQAPRFRLFLDRLQAAFAARVAAGDREALASWRMARDLARAEENLYIDKRTIVLRLLERYVGAR